MGLKAGHITFETLAALKTCRSVYTSMSDSRLNSFIGSFCRYIAVDAAASPEATVEAALRQLKKGSPLAFLTYGNPFFLNKPALLLREKALARGIKVQVLEGVSSIDSLFNMLLLAKDGGYDVRLVNVGEYDRGPRLQTGIDTLYFMVGGGSERHAANIKKFLADLRKLYPADFPAALVNCPNAQLPAGRVVATTVGELGKDLARADKATTLFIRRLQAPVRRPAKRKP